ncbi:MAG: ATPase, T2SS/T4P/T4SS family, partial [Nanoarchaeota archaeon]
KKDIYEILTRTGRRVKVTQDHSLFSLGEDGLIEIKPAELKEGKSFIAVPRTLPIEGQEIKEINLMKYLNNFKGDFLVGEPIKKIFEKYKLKDFKIKKEKYRWWKNHNLIKIEDFLKIDFKFSDDEMRNLVIKSKNTSSIPVIFSISDNFLDFCGLWLGDGSYDNYNGNSVILSNVDEECRNVLKNVAKCINAGYSEMNDGGVSLRIHSTIFYKFMKKVIKLDGYSNSKKIPEFIFGLSNEQIKHFIRGYFSADGCVKKSEVSCASQSIDILETLQTLLLRFGIISRLNDFDRKDKCINMSISNSVNINKFKDIGFLQKRKNEKIKEISIKKSHHTNSDIIPLSITQLKDVDKNKILSWPYLQGMQNIGRNYLQKIAITGSLFNDLSHSDIFWDRVKKIKKIESKETEVFDLSIPNHEKFIVNNIFVHNTREINLPRENWLPSVARSSIGTGKIGEVDLFSLLKNSFRQNPDYVIVGEVRGKEAFVLFQGMASGHSSISTMHADSVDTLIKRLETP